MSSNKEVLSNGSTNSIADSDAVTKTSSRFTDKRDSDNNMFNCSDMGRALRQRWKSQAFRDITSTYYKSLSNTFITVSQSDISDFLLQPPSDVESSADSSVKISALQNIVVSAVKTLKKDIPEKPWHDTIKFVSFDLPLNDVQLLYWIESLVEEAEIDEDGVKSEANTNSSTDAKTLPTTVYEKREVIKQRIISMFPENMKTHKDTQKYIDDIILPFRHFFMSSVVCFALEDIGQGQKQQSSSTTKETVVNTSLPKGILKGAYVYQKQIHAALHAKNLDAVLFIDSMVPCKADKLYRYVLDDLLSGDTTMLILGEMDVAHVKDSQGTIIPTLKRINTESDALLTRLSELDRKIPYTSNYAQYQLICLDDGDDWDNVSFIKSMLSLANSGLAFAQFDIGVSFMSLNELDVAIGWLEKAARCGHSKAMLQLARLHLTIFFDADKMIASAAVEVEKHTDTATSKESNGLGTNIDGVIKGYNSLRTNEEKRYALMKYHMKRCQEWLGNLSEAIWDDETETKDIPEGNVLKTFIDKSAIPLLEKCSLVTKSFTWSRWSSSVVFGTILVLTTIIIMFLFLFSGSALRSTNGNESLFGNNVDTGS